MPSKVAKPKKPSGPARHYPSVTLVGFGNWGTALALALHEAGIPLEEIVVRRKQSAGKLRRNIAARVGARLTTFETAALDADVLWICTPDAAIANIAEQLARTLTQIRRRKPPVVFHSSGALPSDELAGLRAVGAAIASVHPLMSFPQIAAPRSHLPRHGLPQHRLAEIPFAIEGDPRACRVARRIVHALGGEAFTLQANKKALYHAYGAFASPLLVALLTAAVHTGMAAGFTPQEAQRRMQPIVDRTIKNFFANGPEKSFSGPIARGDAATISRHLAALNSRIELRDIYRQLARFAAGSLPAQNRHPIQELLQSPMRPDSRNNSASRTGRRASTA